MNARPTIVEKTAASSRWPESLNARELDERYPGLLDGVGIMAGAANIIMQLARRGVGRGVLESRVHSGNVFRNPTKRARTTFTYLAVAVTGTPEEKLAYRKAVNKSHAQVYSTEKSPVQYHAFDPELQLWVAACLYYGFIDTWSKLYGPPSHAMAEELYQRLITLGTTLQVRPDMWPADLAAYDAYWQREVEKIHIDDEVRSYLAALTDLKFLHPVLRRTFGPLNRFLTVGFLPPRFREEMHFEWTDEQQRKFDKTLATIAAVNRRIPRIIRQFPYNLVMADFRRRLRKGLPLV